MSRSSAIVERLRRRPELAGFLSYYCFALGVGVGFGAGELLSAGSVVRVVLAFGGDLAGYYLGRTLVRAFYRPVG